VGPALAVTINAGTNRLNLRRRTTIGGLTDLDNGASFYDLSSLGNPVTLTDGRRYAILARRSADTITAWLYDELTDDLQEVAAVALSGAEIAAYDGSGVAGPLLRSQLQLLEVDDFRAESFRIGPESVLFEESSPGVSTEVNSYALYNYEEKTWAVGTLARTAWADRSPAFNKPYAAGTDMVLFKHETGTDDDGAAMTAFVESYDMEIPEAGEHLMHVDQLIPDFVSLDGTVNITLKGKKYPQVQDYQVKGPYPVTNATRKISTRIRGRQVALRVESDQIGDAWRMGTLRSRVTPHGKRA
jgi:hypothetical protein